MGTEPGLLQSNRCFQPLGQSHHTPPLTTCFKSIMKYMCVCMYVYTYVDACGRTLVEAFDIGCLDHSPPYTPRQGLLLNWSLGIHLASYALGLQGSLSYTHWVFTQILGIRILALKFKQETFGLLNYLSRNPHSHLSPPPPKKTHYVALVCLYSQKFSYLGSCWNYRHGAPSLAGRHQFL